MTDRSLTPLQAEILLHHYYSPVAHPMQADGGQAWRHALDELGRAGLILPDLSGGVAKMDDYLPSAYLITERGRVLVEAMLALPLPVQKWAMP